MGDFGIVTTAVTKKAETITDGLAYNEVTVHALDLIVNHPFVD